MSRDRSIDIFRGLAIVLMVFFTATLKLSADLPDVLRHNARGSFHAGDVVLPLFLFASGLSLAYYLDVRRRDPKGTTLRDVAGRFGKLALVGVSLSYFSAYGFLEMDEVMLCALLFLACAGLSRAGWKAALGVTFLINTSYIGIVWLGHEDIFTGHYLGGYPAALYYLPVMLIGLTVGKGMMAQGLWCRRTGIIMGSVAAFFIVSWAFVPVDKLAATPSFMMLSVLLSFAIFASLEGALRGAGAGSGAKLTGQLEYLGRKPLRYWLMMFIFFVIPAKLYIRETGGSFPMDIHWPAGVALSLGLMLMMWGASRLVDRWEA